jgi:hypothetical protein
VDLAKDPGGNVVDLAKDPGAQANPSVDFVATSVTLKHNAWGSLMPHFGFILGVDRKWKFGSHQRKRANARGCRAGCLESR